jgi:hypothetical protein
LVTGGTLGLGVAAAAAPTLIGLAGNVSNGLIGGAVATHGINAAAGSFNNLVSNPVSLTIIVGVLGLVLIRR